MIINDLIEIRKAQSNYESLKDYKFFCFDGCVKFFKVDFNRFCGHRANYYDPEGRLLLFGETVCPPDFNHNEQIPKNLKQMINIAEKLSHNLPFLRVDLYNVNGMIYFGEMTFFPAGGLGTFEPNEWDEKLGLLIKLPQ